MACTFVPVELKAPPCDETLYHKMSEITTKAISEMVKKQNDTLEAIAREYAIPKIKGPITKGKLQWRGIRLHVYNYHDRYEYAIFQRGVQIGPSVETSLIIPGMDGYS